MYTKNPRNHQSSTAKSFNLTQFNERFFNNEMELVKVFISARFSAGYVCPECQHTKYRWLKKRKVCQCKQCYHQTYLLAGTIFQDSKLSFYQLLLGIFLFVTNQSGINGSTLAIYMGVNVNTARLFLRKLRSACQTSNALVILKGIIDFDGAYLGGVDQGGKRGLGSNKQTALIGIEIAQTIKEDGRVIEFPGKARISLVSSENGEDVVAFMKTCVQEGTAVRSDGGKGISVLNQIRKDIDGNPLLDSNGNTINKYNYQLQAEKFDKQSDSLEFVHKFISNLKSLFLGVYHGINLQYMDLYAEEFTWRYNHRTDSNNLKKYRVY